MFFNSTSVSDKASGGDGYNYFLAMGSSENTFVGGNLLKWEPPTVAGNGPMAVGGVVFASPPCDHLGSEKVSGSALSRTLNSVISISMNFSPSRLP